LRGLMPDHELFGEGPMKNGFLQDSVNCIHD
jgi:hypothetical protein